VILYNYASYKGYNVNPQGNLSAFTNGAEAFPWARNAMEWAVGCGLISGKGGSTLSPKGTATRIEVAQLLMNFCEAFSK